MASGKAPLHQQRSLRPRRKSPDEVGDTLVTEGPLRFTGGVGSTCQAGATPQKTWVV
ncbi:MAG: hypothetical protein KAI47_09540 [Deltaproteobacteria bacterium]|nr:hypothetical protein [Deltaproteobacteria bacterium]